MKSNYVVTLERSKPPLIDYVAHSSLMSCLNQAISFCRIDGGNSLLLIVGPSHAGKSALLSLLSRHLSAEVFSTDSPDYMHVIGATALTSREGRTTPKYIYSTLLEDLQHPLFYTDHLESSADYRPNIRFDETFLLRRLRSSMEARDTRFTMLDEGQYLVRAKDADFKASLLESLKSLVTPRSSLIMAGGYELAEVVLSARAHLAARTIVLHLSRYKNSPEDKEQWLAILKAYSVSSCLRLSQPDLLIRNADLLHEQCHGVVGMLEKRLIACKMRSESNDAAIDTAILTATAPSQNAWNTMQVDIAHGEEVLSAYEVGVAPTAKKPRPAPKKKNGARPFTRKSQRSRAKVSV